MIKNINLKILLKYITIFFVAVILSQASINGLSPFVFAFFIACLYVCLDEKLCAIFTMLASIISSPTLENFLISLTVVAVGLIAFYIHKFAKRKIALLTTFAIFLISLTTYIYYNYSNFTNLICYILLGIISLFVFVVVLQVLLLRKNCFKLTLDETICFLFSVALIGLGLSNVEIFNILLYRAVLMLIILLCVAIGHANLTYCIVLAFSFGVALNTMSLIPVAEFMIVSLIAGIFSMPNKFKIVAISLIGDIFIQLFFLSKGWELLYALIPLVLACILFILIPNRTISSLSDVVYVKKSEISSRNLINTTRKNIKKRMRELSNVFLDMKHIHLNMVKKDLTKDELINMLNREVINTCCKDCIDKFRCTRSLGTDNKSNLQTLVEMGVTKGKVTLLDIPASLTNRCSKVNQLIAQINQINDEYRQYKNMMADVNNVKILLADQMGAVSKLLLTLGDEIDANVRFDIAKENKIISRLLSQNIHCREVLLYSEKHDEISAMLIVKTDSTCEPVLEKVVSEILKCQMQIVKINPLEEGDYSSVLLKKKGRYDCIFGLASCNKSGNVECGDCHSIIRLGNDKFMLALCDGMGTGANANKMSAMTLGLIENFYKVGFDNDVILESVNKLLAVNNQENYSTLDVCLLDLEKEIADFIKVGAPFGLIKRDNNIEIVEGGSLPIGALDTISPKIHKTTISTSDIVILATDGITDAFDGEENLVEYVSKLANNNPQTIAESILNEALMLNEMSAKDDMTVLVARTILKSKN